MNDVAASRRLVEFLRARGAGAGVAVGAELREGDDADALASAVALTGATCVRLDPAAPLEMRRALVFAARARFVLSVTDALYEVPALPIDLVLEAAGEIELDVEVDLTVSHDPPAGAALV